MIKSKSAAYQGYKENLSYENIKRINSLNKNIHEDDDVNSADNFDGDNYYKKCKSLLNYNDNVM